MESPPTTTGGLSEAAKRFVRRLLTVGENRFELLLVEVQEERERLLQAILLALGVAAFGLLAGVALTCTLVVSLPERWRVWGLLVLTTLYGTAGVYCYRRLATVQRNWQNLPATLDQLRKDRACLEEHLK